MAAIKTANVNARIDLNVKTQAEAILSRIGQVLSFTLAMVLRVLHL